LELTFRDNVKRRAPFELHGWALRTAIEEFELTGRTAVRDVAPCIERAGVLSAAGDLEGVRPRGPSRKRRLSGHVSPAVLLESGRRAEALAPAVEELRERIFGSRRPPCSSVSHAARWIAAEAEQCAQPTVGDRARANELIREAREQVAEAGRLIGTAMRVEVRSRLLPHYAFPTKGRPVVVHSHVAPGSRIDVLQARTARMADDSGFPQEQLVFWVLTGARPILPPVSVTRSETRGGPPRWPCACKEPTGKPVTRTGESCELCGQRRPAIVDRQVVDRDEVRLTIRHRLTFAQLLQLHNSVFGTKAQRLSDTDRRLLELVSELGPPPKRERGKRGQVADYCRRLVQLARSRRLRLNERNAMMKLLRLRKRGLLDQAPE
jgi:hypothetical protein